ncbi:alpha/beta fold hydrolase [Salinicoccus halodurans]|uniref:Pimeloyl-ACP methyl ester carboxylesterase n=1 Tax=Salinicoccus halodurans TaxID=407035 RepID=A0AA94HCF2_9STAP|nr:alpha/beta hydrolase [Salinicoccus halodurans]SFK52942.1 Pimeloyl-ACP methyl ester carboxylesterase [Salinicoccus halodurans]
MQLYYEETGAQDAPVIVFIHGIGAGSWMWWEQTEEFEDYRCINVDLPGHGNSVDVPWVSVDDTAGKIIQLIEGNFPGERVHIVGLSLGGHMVMELILKYPGMFQSAFVSGITTRPAINWLTGKIQIYMFERMKNNPKAVERLAEERYRLEGERKIQFKRDLDKMSMETYSEIVDEVLRFKLHDGFRTVDVPLMVTAGEDESAIIKESVFEIPEMMPNASGKLIPQAGHGWNVTMPKTFNKECRHWIEAHA